MAITKAKKIDQLKALVEKFKKAQGVAFIKFDRVTVEEVQVIRRALRAKGMSYIVVKKTLIALAAKETGLGDFSSDMLEGSVAVIVSQTDAVQPAQEIKTLKKDFFNKATQFAKFDFAGALFEGKFLDAAETARFADTATREESLAKIMGMLRSGPQGLHTVLQSGFRRNINVLQNADKFTK